MQLLAIDMVCLLFMEASLKTCLSTLIKNDVSGAKRIDPLSGPSALTLFSLSTLPTFFTLQHLSSFWLPQASSGVVVIKKSFASFFASHSFAKDAMPASRDP
jgi:hypothetical protein